MEARLCRERGHMHSRRRLSRVRNSLVLGLRMLNYFARQPTNGFQIELGGLQEFLFFVSNHSIMLVLTISLIVRLPRHRTFKPSLNASLGSLMISPRFPETDPRIERVCQKVDGVHRRLQHCVSKFTTPVTLYSLWVW